MPTAMASELTQASEPFQRLAQASRRELERVLLVGDTPATSELSRFVYRGFNRPRATSLLRIRKFMKAFSSSESGRVQGCNESVVQNQLEDPWIGRPSDVAPKRYGFFDVRPVDAESRDNAYLHALLFDYGAQGNAWYDPARFLRDYVVRVDDGSDELLLGKAYLALGAVRLPLGFFILERHRPR